MLQDRNRVIKALERDHPNQFILDSAVENLESILDIKAFLDEYLAYLEKTSGKLTALHNMKLVLLRALASNYALLGARRKEWIACWKLFTYRHNFFDQAFTNR